MQRFNMEARKYGEWFPDHDNFIETGNLAETREAISEFWENDGS